MQAPILPVRVEPLLLPGLRAAFPDLTIGTEKQELSPPYRCAVLVADPQQMQNPISQYVRIRLSVWDVRADGSGNFQAAQTLASDIIQWITGHGTMTPLTGAELSSGPIRTSDDNSEFAYAILLLTVAIA